MAAKFKLMITIFGFLLLLCAQTFAECIPADDACAPKKKLDEWDKSALFGFNSTSGNSKTLLLTIAGNAHLERNNSIFDAAAQYGYGEDKTDPAEGKDTTTRDNFLGSVSYDYLISERTYLGLGTKLVYDKIADIDYRDNINPTLGYYLLRDNSFKFRVEAGPSYVFEKVAGETNNYFSPRIAERFEWAITCSSKIFEAAELLLDTSDSNNYMVNAEAGIEAAISTNLSLVLKAQDSLDNVPAAGKDKNDLAIISAVKLAL